MSTNKSQHTLPIWTEIEYGTTCFSNYLSEPVLIPKDTKFFICNDKGERKPVKLVFTVFKPEGTDEWLDDPVPGINLIQALGDDDEQIEPVKAIYLGDTPAELLTVVREDDKEIVFKIDWTYGKAELSGGKITGEGILCRKDDFGDNGLTLKMTPDEGEPFEMHVIIPQTGFALLDKDGKRIIGNISIKKSDIDDYEYAFIGDEKNDRFSILLDNNKMNYMCILRDDGRLSVRDIRDRLAVVTEINAHGPLSELMMNAEQILIKSKNKRWNIDVTGAASVQTDIECSPASLADYAYEQFKKGKEDEQKTAFELLDMEKPLAFQWCWLKPDNWQKAGDSDFDSFMHQLTALSYIHQAPIQGDQLQARNNKKKIRRAARNVADFISGEKDIWSLPADDRKEIVYCSYSFHREFTEAFDSFQNE